MSKIVSLVNTTLFAIIIDETKRTCLLKNVYIVMILLTRNKKKVCDSFLGLVELDNSGSSAAGIYEVLRGYLVSVGVNIENLTGFDFLTHYSTFILSPKVCNDIPVNNDFN